MFPAVASVAAVGLETLGTLSTRTALRDIRQTVLKDARRPCRLRGYDRVWSCV